MYNKILKGVASVLSAALVLGSVVMSVVPAQAKTVNGTEVTYTMSELTQAFKNDGVEVSASGTGVSISYAGGWTNAFFVVPDEVLKAGVLGAKCDIDSTTELCIKFCKDDSGDQAADVDYALYTTDIDISGKSADDRAAAKYFGIAALSEGITYNVKSITFTTENPVADGAASDDGGSKSDTSDSTPAATTSSKTGESTTMVWVVCILGALFMMSAAGMLTAQKKRR